MRDNYYLSVFKTKNQAVFLYSTHCEYYQLST